MNNISIKKFISLLICGIFAFATLKPIKVNASPLNSTSIKIQNKTINIKITKDSKNIRKSEVIDGNKKYVSIYHKDTNKLESIEKDLLDNTETKEILDLNLAKTQTLKNNLNKSISEPGGGGSTWTIEDSCRCNADLKSFQYGYIRYKDKATGKRYWDLEKRGDKSKPFVQEISSNSTFLHNFNNAVYEMYQNLAKLGVAAGGGLGSVLLILASSGTAAVIAGKVAAAAGAEVVGSAMGLWNARHRADTAYSYIFE